MFSKLSTLLKCHHVKLMECLAMIKALLEAIKDALGGTLTVTPDGIFEGLFNDLTDSIVAAIEAGAEAGEEITVTIDTSGGPVEVTGSVTIDGDVSIDWSGIKDALEGLTVQAEITNYEDLVALLTAEDTTITVDGVVGLDDATLESLLSGMNDIVEAVKNQIYKDWEKETDKCIYDADGNVIPMAGVYLEYTYQNGVVVGTPTSVKSIMDDQGNWSAYVLGEGEKVGPCVGGCPCVITKSEVCLKVGEVVLNAYAIRKVTEDATTLLRYEDALGNTVEGEVTACTCDAVDTLEEGGGDGPIGDPVTCSSRKLGSDFVSNASGEGTHTEDSLNDTNGPINSFSGTFTVTDSAGTAHTFNNGDTVSGMASGSVQSVTFSGLINWSDGAETYQCTVSDKALSANFTVQ